MATKRLVSTIELPGIIVVRWAEMNIAPENEIIALQKYLGDLAETHRTSTFVVNMENVRTLTSQILNALLYLQIKTVRRSEQLRLCHVSYESIAVLRATQTAQFFRILSDEESAIADPGEQFALAMEEGDYD